MLKKNKRTDELIMDKIAIYLNSLSRGGAERVSVILAEYFANRNVECILLTTNTATEEYTVPKKVKRISLNNEKTFLKKIIALRKIIKGEKIKKVLIMDTPGCIYAIPATINLNVKKIVSERNDPHNFSGKKIVKIISRLLMRTADGFVFQTLDAQKYYQKLLKNNGVIIYNPLFSKKLPIRDERKIEYNIVSVGRLTEQKNQKMLIDAFSKICDRFSEYSLTIFGEGPLREELTNYIKEINLENRIFLPGNKENVTDLIKNASLFVLTSNYEGMPNALIEAMAIGIPCISTDCPCGGPRTLIKHMKNGMLVQLNDVSGLAKMLKYCIENKEVMLKISRESIKIKDELDMNKICKQWYEYIKSI